MFLERANARDTKWMLCFHVAQTGKHLLRAQIVSEQNHKQFLCPGHKICVRNKCCARGQTGKHLCRQQCVRNKLSSFARAFTTRSMIARHGVFTWYEMTWHDMALEWRGIMWITWHEMTCGDVTWGDMSRWSRQIMSFQIPTWPQDTTSQIPKMKISLLNLVMLSV